MSKARQKAGIHYAVMHANNSQKELAELLGVHPTAVGKWVRKGYVPDGKVKQIHEMYGIPRETLCNPMYFEVIFGEGVDIERIMAAIRHYGS